ncbi:MAG: Fe-S cluster assembly protein IscX [Pseudomonadota bacterium]|nr:Fe-S cluster assembly protein IscX [Pseudomonadota bacterium]
MKLKWTDSLGIAQVLVEKYPDVDPRYVRFTELYGWIIQLSEFDDAPERSGEKILEAIQMSWIDEAD